MTPDLVSSRYRVIDAIGEGGMGQVYAALDETLKRRVALKAIRADHRLNPEARARFVREARVLSQLDHPHICRVFDYLETPENDWIVLELVEGHTLTAVMHRGLPPQQRLAIATQIADVLVATHAAGIVHRDLKPGNVMITEGGDAKVLDFGLSAPLPRDIAPTPLNAGAALSDAGFEAAMEETRLPDPGPAVRAARLVDVSQFSSEAGSIMGTLAYMSPEQARGEVATSASDMYSYGLLLQELFGGQPPYGDVTDRRALLARAQRGDSLPPAGLPAALEALVARLKSPAPAQRPTALDTLERLRWIADGPRRRRRNLVVAALLLVALTGLVRYTVDLSRERSAAVAAREEADRRRGQAEGLIGFMVGDLRTKLAAVGRLEILDEVGKQALSYFASVSADSLSDEELFRRSQALHQLGQVRQARADMAGALKAYEDSLAQAKEVARRQPDNAAWQLGLGTSHFYIGELKMRRGELAEALAHFEAYKGIAERLVARDPGNFEWRLELSYGFSNVAAIYSRQGNLPAAREHLLKTAAIQAQLASERPTNSTLQTSRANSFSRLGIVQDGLGDLEAAAESFARELDIYERLLASDPRNASVRRRMEVSHIFRANLLKALGLIDEAARHAGAAVREARALVALDSSNANWQRDLGVSELMAARVDLEQRRTRQAIGRFQAALVILASLAQRDPSQAGPQRDVAKADLGLGEAFQAAGDLPEAARHVDLALARLRPLAARDPADIDTRRELATTENARGLLWSAQGEPRRGAAAWTHSAQLLESVARNSHDRTLLDPWVRSLLYLGRVDEAARGASKLSEMHYREPSYLRLWQQQRGTTGAPEQR